MSLMNKSLIRRDAKSGRYSIHELLRQYAEEQLYQSGNQNAINQAHMSYFADFMAQRTPDIKGKRQVDALNEVEADFDNVRSTWNYAVEYVEYDALGQMMEALLLYCEMRGMYVIGEGLFDEAMKLCNL